MFKLIRIYSIGLVALSWMFSGGPRLFALPAFPGAEGFGSETPGGRGGRVIAVTSLDDSGPGSLRDAVTAKGPRTVVFRVGGTIQLKSHLRITEPFITIAGQTAPGDGILLRDAGLYVQTHDVVIRFIRSRVGASLVEKFNTQDALQISGDDTYNVVVDHCSFSWSIDECVGIRVPAHDVTFSWNIVSEALRQPFTKEQIGKERSHSMSLILSGGPTRCSLHHNLLALCNSRNPRIQGGRHGFINNVVYGWGWLSGTFSRDPEVNFIGNYYKPGPASLDIKAICEKADGLGQIYVRGNRSPQRPNDDMAEWEPIVNAPEEGHRVIEPFPMPLVSETSAEEAYEAVLRHAGAAAPRRDAVDRRTVRYVRLGMGEKIDRPEDAGGYPEMRSGESPTDTDGDGMPDDWEGAQGFDPADAADGSDDATGDGYTNLETYLNALTDEQLMLRPSIRPVSVDRPAGPFTVLSGVRKLPVIEVAGDHRTYYTHAYFEDEAEIVIQMSPRWAREAQLMPERFRNDFNVGVSEVRFRVFEEGTRILETPRGPDARRLVLFLEKWPVDAPQFSDPNVVDSRRFGVLGHRDNATRKLQLALDEASRIPGGVVVYVPDGQHDIDTLRIPSHTTLYLAASSVLYSSGERNEGPMILLDHVEDARVSGPGAIDGRGSEGTSRRPVISVRNCKGVRISEVVIRDAAGVGIEVVKSEDVELRCAKVVAGGDREGTGGLELDGSQRVRCDRCFFSSTQQPVTVKSSGGDDAEPVEDISIRECVMTGLRGVVIGPETSKAVRHILVQDSDIVGALYGLEIVQQGMGGIEGLVFRDMTMQLRQQSDAVGGGRPFGILNYTTAPLRDILFDRIVTNAMTTSLIRGLYNGWVEDVKFWGVRIQAEPLSQVRKSYDLPPLFDLLRVKSPQFRFLYLSWPGDREQHWGVIVVSQETENMRLDKEEVFEHQATKPAD